MKKKYRSKLYLLSVLLFAAVAVWFVISAVYNSVMNGALLCYSIEGEYPSDLEYLEKHYGVRINGDKYIVDYSYFGANIRPTVTVIEKEGTE